MKRVIGLFMGAGVAVAVSAGEAPKASSSTPPVRTISVKEMLLIGPSTPKLHALAMITQGKVPGGIDASYLPGLKACSEDEALPIRSVTARVLGKYFIEGQEAPDPEAVALLIRLSKDSAKDVRFSAAYYGLSRIRHKSPEVVRALLDVAADNREPTLLAQIKDSLADNKDEVKRLLEEKLAGDGGVAYYELYEELIGEPAPHSEKFLSKPSSRPYLYVFQVGEGEDPEAFRQTLEQALKAAGIKNPELFLSKSASPVLLLKTYLTRDRLAVKKAFGKPDAPFQIVQEMWLTPDVEVQIDAMRKNKTAGNGPRE